MNPFTKYSISVSAESEVEEESEELAVPDSDDEVTSEVADMIERVDVIEEVKDDLIQLHQKLASMESSGSTFDDNHADLVKLMINKSMARVGGSVTDVAPSLESDDYIERTDIVASMEGVGEAIKAGAKAAWTAIVKMLTSLLEYVKAKFSKIKALASRFNKVNTILDRYSNKSVSVVYASPVVGHELTPTFGALLYTYEKLVNDLIDTHGAAPTSGVQRVKIFTLKESPAEGEVTTVKKALEFTRGAEKLLVKLEQSGLLERIEKQLAESEVYQKDNTAKNPSNDPNYRADYVTWAKEARNRVEILINGLMAFRILDEKKES